MNHKRADLLEKHFPKSVARRLAIQTEHLTDEKLDDLLLRTLPEHPPDKCSYCGGPPDGLAFDLDEGWLCEPCRAAG